MCPLTRQEVGEPESARSSALCATAQQLGRKPVEKLPQMASAIGATSEKR